MRNGLRSLGEDAQRRVASGTRQCLVHGDRHVIDRREVGGADLIRRQAARLHQNLRLQENLRLNLDLPLVGLRVAGRGNHGEQRLGVGL